MSAFLCSPEHVGTLASFTAAHTSGNLAAEDLAKEWAGLNLRSIAARYHDDDIDAAAGDNGYSYSFEYVAACQSEASNPASITAVEALKLIHCLEYQSCEFDGWEETEAAQLLRRAEKIAARAVAGYDDAPWGFDRAPVGNVALATKAPEPIPVVHVSLDDTLKQFRGELKREFPGTKFSVRRSRGTAYGWVHCDWTDGPTYDEVNSIANMYAGSGFDGMTDSTYTIEQTSADKDGNLVRVQYGTRGINCSRTISAELANKLIPIVAAYWGLTELPVAIPSYSGYRFEPEVGRMNVRNDVDVDWYTAIHRASNGLYDREGA